MPKIVYYALHVAQDSESKRVTRYDLICVLEQAPQGGGPFILSYEKLPEIIASLNRVSRTCKLVANCFIGVGTVLITIKVIQGACRFLHRRKMR